MNDLLLQALRNMDDQTTIIDINPVVGGDINESFYVRTKKEQYFVKFNANVSKDFFDREVYGLNLIRNTKTVHVPNVYGVHHLETENKAMLMMEWIEGKETSETQEQLGFDLAHLHKSNEKFFGLKYDTYIGRLTQKNGQFQDWISYFRDRRLMPQIYLAEELGRMNLKRRKKSEKLLDLLDQWLPKDCNSSLLHGDLWGGNWLSGKNGKPYLIDPSVFYGHHEFEIAFTELFGGFSPRFYRAYEEVLPLSKEYQDRKPLYQLYYLLIHLNMFGETYGSSIDRVLTYYIGN